MSEKRFVLKELNFEDVVIEDTNTMSQYSIYGCEDLLNSLCGENEQLRQDHIRQANEIKLLRAEYSKIPPKIREVWKE